MIKPIQQANLQQALKKFKKANSTSVTDPQLVVQILASMQSTQSREGILVKEGTGFFQVKTSQLLYCCSYENVTFGVTANKLAIIDETIDES